MSLGVMRQMRDAERICAQAIQDGDIEAEDWARDQIDKLTDQLEGVR